MPIILGMMTMDYHVNEKSDLKEGKTRIQWAGTEMPVLALIKERFRKEKTLKGIRISACLHVTSETANLCIALKEGGAEVALCASNPLSTCDSVAHSLVKDHGVSVFAVHGEDNDTYYDHISSVLDIKPNITMDDGGDLVSFIHKDRRELLETILAGTEETTTGVKRFKNMERDGVLEYPVIAVNDALTKYLFDNRYGTGQSTIDGILRATNILLAGRKFVVAGYGWCGRGIAQRARGMGAHVVVTEVDPVRALEAHMDGFTVQKMDEAVKSGEIFVTATGNTSLITEEHFEHMKDGAIMANSGHFNVEIQVEALEKISVGKKKIRSEITEYTLGDGRKLYVLGSGRLINLAAAEGHPAAVMDMSFANQALCVEHIVVEHSNLDNRVYKVPDCIDKQVAELKLEALGVSIDSLTEEQNQYLCGWKTGT